MKGGMMNAKDERETGKGERRNEDWEGEYGGGWGGTAGSNQQKC